MGPGNTSKLKIDADVKTHASIDGIFILRTVFFFFKKKLMLARNTTKTLNVVERLEQWFVYLLVMTHAPRLF